MRAKIGLWLVVLAIGCGQLHGEDIFDESDDVQELILRGQGLINRIKEKTDTLKIRLSQDDVIEGKITLNDTGSYILLDNIISDIEINGVNISLDLSGKSVIGTLKITGNATVVEHGAFVELPPLLAEVAAVPAIHITNTAQNVVLRHCFIKCNDSISVTGDPVAGRNAVEVAGRVVKIFDCSILAGASASLTDTLSMNTTATAADGGTCIVLSGSAEKVRVIDCVMASGNAGSSLYGDGGNGGHGISIKDTVSHVEIRNCTVFQTGSGGTPNGSGGHGVIIASDVIDAVVYDCHIRNTGNGAAPGGVGGKAVQDAVTTAGSVSILYRNFAHNIANALKFDVQGTGVEKGILSPNPPDATVINPFANVYVS